MKPKRASTIRRKLVTKVVAPEAKWVAYKDRVDKEEIVEEKPPEVEVKPVVFMSPDEERVIKKFKEIGKYTN